MSSRFPLLILAPAALVFVFASPVTAQESPSETLFNQGLEEMQAGRYDKGCPALAESQRLDPRPGTLFTLAECEAKRGRIATAIARYDEYLLLFASMSADKQAKQYGRDKIAAEQKAALMPELPQLTLTLAPSAPRGTVVKRDGLVVAEAALGVALPVDPGEHVISLEPPGGPVTEERLTIAKGEKKQMMLEPKLGPSASEGPQPNGPSVPVSPTPDAGMSSRKVAMFTAGGVGAAGLAVGLIAGAVTLGKAGQIKDKCPAGSCETPADLDLASSAQTSGLVSSIGFGVGIVGLGAAAILYFTDPARNKTSTAPKTAKGRWMSADVLSSGRDGALLILKGGW